MTIGIMSCVSTKLKGTHKAKDIYISNLFNKSYEYCIKKYDLIIILSAKYYVLNLDDEINYYDLTLNKFSEKQKIAWAARCYIQLKNKHLLNNNNEIFWHCGINYNIYISQLINNYFPDIKQNFLLKGLTIGNQLKWYKEKNKII